MPFSVDVELESAFDQLVFVEPAVWCDFLQVPQIGHVGQRDVKVGVVRKFGERFCRFIVNGMEIDSYSADKHDPLGKHFRDVVTGAKQILESGFIIFGCHNE